MSTFALVLVFHCNRLFKDLHKERIGIFLLSFFYVNYPQAKDLCASGFTEERLSNWSVLTSSPPV